MDNEWLQKKIWFARNAARILANNSGCVDEKKYKEIEKHLTKAYMLMKEINKTFDSSS